MGIKNNIMRLVFSAEVALLTGLGYQGLYMGPAISKGELKRVMVPKLPTDCLEGVVVTSYQLPWFTNSQ